MNLDPIVEEEEEEESISPYSPPMVTLVTEQDDHTTLANILREMEISRRETFDQLRADRRQSEMMLQEHIQRLENREEERRRMRSSSESSIGMWKEKKEAWFWGRKKVQQPSSKITTSNSDSQVQRRAWPQKLPWMGVKSGPNFQYSFSYWPRTSRFSCVRIWGLCHDLVASIVYGQY